MRKFGSDRMAGMMDKFRIEEDVPMEHKWFSKSIQKAQERVEQNHFEARKQILKYDNVLSQQRDMVYDLRDRAIEQESLREDMASDGGGCAHRQDGRNAARRRPAGVGRRGAADMDGAAVRRGASAGASHQPRDAAR